MKSILNWTINILFIAAEFISCISCAFMIYFCLMFFSTAVLLKIAWLPIIVVIGFAGSFSSNLITVYKIMKERLENENKE